VAVNVNDKKRKAVKSCEKQISTCKSVAISFQAVWIADDKNQLHVAKRSVSGYRWESPVLSGLPSSSKWKCVTTSSYFSSHTGAWESLVWAARSNGEIICISSTSHDNNDDHHQSYILSPPSDIIHPNIICVSAYSITFCKVSCGSESVWALDTNGKLFFRLGVTETSNSANLTSAWLPVDTPAGRKVTQIACGPSDFNVWCVDSAGNVFVRLGLGPSMLIGNSWQPVEGALLKTLVLSNHALWGLCSDGTIIGRQLDDITGDFWNTIPGCFKQLAVTPQDEMWAINSNEELRYCHKSLYHPPILQELNMQNALKSQQKVTENTAARGSNEEISPDTTDVDINEWEII